MSNPNVTTVYKPDADGIAATAKALQGGALAAFPTETVYGLGADATNGEAVAAIYAAKGRPSFNPLIVHVNNYEQAAEYVYVSELSKKLIDAFWPGPLTLVLPRRADCKLSLLVSAGLPTVAIRCPDHPVAQAVIAAAGRPIAAPSANRSGRISPTTAAHVFNDLNGRVSAIVDGGSTKIGVESTVLGFDLNKPVLLRPGGLARAAIEAITGPLMAPVAGVISSPGQMTSHYAPNATVRLNATTVSADEALLAFGPEPLTGAARTMNLSPSGNLIEAASNLFAMLHALDEDGATKIAVMPVPVDGLGEAINDRLHRAAAPRDTPTAG